MYTFVDKMYELTVIVAAKKKRIMLTTNAA